MKKSFILIFAFISFCTSVIAQTETPKVSEEYTKNEKIMRMALKYNDLNVAKNALYQMIYLAPENKSLKDSLAILYFNIGSYTECILISREILSENSTNSSVLELKAISEQNIGMFKESLVDYEALYAKNKNIYHLYQIATLQYELKRFGECDQSIATIIADKESEKQEISIVTGDRRQQKVPIKAACLNMRGVLALETGKNEIAKTSFQEALKISPDFFLAKNNLTISEKKSEPAKSTVKPK